jgi:hypothetical protein
MKHARAMSICAAGRLMSVFAVGACLLGAGACHRGGAGAGAGAGAGVGANADSDDAPKAAAPISQADKDDKQRDDALKLTPTDITKLGIVVAPLVAASFQAEATGYGQVVGRDAVIQALSEIEVAQIRVTQSHAVLERSRQLEGTAGADAIPEHEAAVRQDAEDRSAAFLARAKMSSLLGQQAARALSANRALVDGLSAGRYKLVRAALPLGAVRGDATPSLRLVRLDAPPGDAGWRALHVWPGPVEAGVPGRSFLVIVDAPTLAEGERLMAYAAAAGGGKERGGDGEVLQGAVVPASALLVSGDDAWVYVEHEPGNFSRERLDTTHPLAAGYFVTGKLVAGTRVITTGAGMLHSRELDVSPDD